LAYATSLSFWIAQTSTQDCHRAKDIFSSFKTK